MGGGNLTYLTYIPLRLPVGVDKCYISPHDTNLTHLILILSEDDMRRYIVGPDWF